MENNTETKKMVIELGSCNGEEEQFLAWMEKNYPEIETVIENTMDGGLFEYGEYGWEKVDGWVEQENYWDQYCNDDKTSKSRHIKMYDYSGSPTKEALKFAESLEYQDVDDAIKMFNELPKYIRNSVMENITFRDDNDEVIDLY